MHGACGAPAEDVELAVAIDVLDRLLAATPPSGRTPGTNEAVARQLEADFRAVGVTDVTIEPFSIPVSTAMNHSLELSGAPDLDGPHEHEVNVFGGDGVVSSGSLFDVGNAAQVMPAAAGKVALLDFSPTRSLRTQYRNAVASGAVGVVIDSKYATVRQRNVWLLSGASSIDGPIPVMTVQESVAAAAREKLEAGTDVRVSMSSDSSVSPRTAYNVIARIPGTTHPDRVLLVNGHLDSWYAGAADDGQAVAALVALAKYFVAHPLPYTLELVAFDCEETFLLGSNHYIRQRLPTVRDTLVGAISLEMLAPKNVEFAIVTMDPREVWAPILEAAGLTDIFKLSISPAEQMMLFGGEVPSDQGTFWHFGIPGFFLVSTYTEYHTPDDNAENTDEDRYGKILTALGQTLREIGDAPPESLDVRPASSIELTPTITEHMRRRVAGAVVATNLRAGTQIENATVTVSVYSDDYSAIVASAPATFVPGSGYEFVINYDFVTGTPYMMSIDASIPSEAAGRSLVRLDPL